MSVTIITIEVNIGSQPDPDMNVAMLDKFQKLCSMLSLYDIHTIFTGTGCRFREATTELINYMEKKGIEPKGIKVVYCDILGTSSYIRESNVVMSNGESIPKDKYLPPTKTPGVDVWSFVSKLPTGTVLIADRDFITALSMEDVEGGMNLYTANPKSMSIEIAQQEHQTQIYQV